MSTAPGISGDVYEDVIDPSGAKGVSEMHNAVNRLQQRAVNSRAIASYSAKIYQLNNSADGHLKMSAGASAWGASLGFGYQNQWRENHRYLLIDATQEMYTMSAQVPEDGVFSVPAEALPNHLMMGSVTYGHRALVLIDTKTIDDQTAVDFAAAYKAIAANANFSLQNLVRNLSQETEIRMYFVGGTNPGLVVLDKKSLLQRLNEYFKEASIRDAKPIRYQFRGMNNAVLIARSATDYFPVRHCMPDVDERDIHVTVTLSSIVNESNPGEEIKLGISQYLYAYRPDGALIPDRNNQSPRIICWWEGGGPGCIGPSTFRGTLSNLGIGRSYVMKQGDLRNGGGIDVGPDYIAMYRTSIGGSTNSTINGKRRESLGDAINRALLSKSPQEHKFYMNLEGRRFAITYLVQARAAQG